MKILKTDPARFRRGKYPWNKWMDGRQREAKRGQDFTVSVPAFRSVMFQEAARRGGHIVSRVIAENAIQFQFIKGKRQ